MPDEPSNKKGAVDKGRKRTREDSSQTDEEDECDQHHKHGCKKCFGIKEKLNMLLAILPELETYEKRITLLEEENKTLQMSLENSQAEIDLKAIVYDVNSKARSSQHLQ